MRLALHGNLRWMVPTLQFCWHPIPRHPRPVQVQPIRTSCSLPLVSSSVVQSPAVRNVNMTLETDSVRHSQYHTGANDHLLPVAVKTPTLAATAPTCGVHHLLQENPNIPYVRTVGAGLTEDGAHPFKKVKLVGLDTESIQELLITNNRWTVINETICSLSRPYCIHVGKHLFRSSTRLVIRLARFQTRVTL